MKILTTAVGITSFVIFASSTISTESAIAVTINFDNLSGGTTVTNQFPEATFLTSSSDFEARILSFSTASAPNVLAVYSTVGGTLDAMQDLFVDFTNPVNNLTFNIVADNQTNLGLVDVFTNGAFEQQVSLIADGNFSTSDLIDLSSFTNITRIEFNSITDPGGIVYDDFTFDVAETQPVPEPFTILGTATALGFGALFKRKNTFKKAAE